MTELYCIKRFYATRRTRIQRRNLTLEQAREWCSRPDTSSKTHPNGRNGAKSEWFDGFTKQA